MIYDLSVSVMVGLASGVLSCAAVISGWGEVFCHMLPSPETSVRIRCQHTYALQSPCLKCGPCQLIDYVRLDLPWMVRQKDSDSPLRRAWAFRVASIYWKSPTDPSLIKTVSDKEVWMATSFLKEQTTWEETSIPHQPILKWKNPAI